ncbi:MAG: MBL fold metallo-hydrolase [Aquabacterium sp.]|jgi:glyoxylase-like metal-dependent hydrolase (beta-lactamase superfamily II)|uniref:MBL fold metallo-hydrolase n=1 Tax=Aquabacterium sp. TaxID=1872578 RepID=UPI003BB08E36
MHAFLLAHIQVLERGWLSSNNIVFAQADVPTVVDTGYVSHGEATERLLDEALGGRPLARIVNTHLHSDHAGGNARLQRRHGCRVVIPPGLREAVDAWDEERLSYTPSGQECERFTYDEVLAIGRRIELGGQEWDVLPAGGHDADMVMLWNPHEGVLISADALWRNGFGVIFPELAGESGFAEQQATLDLISQLAPRVVIPGHGAPFTEVQDALSIAHARIRWLAEDPKRNVDNALKGLVAFKLLDRGRMPRAEVQTLIERHLLTQRGIRAVIGDDTEPLTDWVISQLVRVGAARLEDGALVAG